MKAKITLTNGDGTVFEGEVELFPVGKTAFRKEKAKVTPSTATTTELNFSLNERAFMKTYASSLSGPKKFALVVSFLVGGELGKEVELKEIQKLWNRMTASNLLGMEFNYKYPTAAKEQGWVDTKRKGFYSLCPDWGNALEGE